MHGRASLYLLPRTHLTQATMLRCSCKLTAIATSLKIRRTRLDGTLGGTWSRRGNPPSEKGKSHKATPSSVGEKWSSARRNTIETALRHMSSGGLFAHHWSLFLNLTSNVAGTFERHFRCMRNIYTSWTRPHRCCMGRMM